ncbi:aminopeptidase N, partial [Pseudomonas syringae pv. tagetis]|uniref:M1 family aminopeptidase n=1 Tax=Pseudomonas syringae group genomosp. 7 TaxID=251699 RepID=UPI0037706408
TMSQREVTLRIYVEPEKIDKSQHAMTSLKKTMRWDEETYGREYDQDIFMIVAVNDFNMGAKENKRLNIFNSSAVQAR